MRKSLWILALTLAVAAHAGDPAPADPLPETKCALERLARYASADPKLAERKIILVYFTPSDREPPSGYRERLDRIMNDIRDFYAKEMERHGFGPRTVHLEADAAGRLIVHDVKGKLAAPEYLGDKGKEIAAESKPVLLAQGVDPSRESVVYFCNLRTEKLGTITGIGPYYGGGSPWKGACWFTDATILDPEKLPQKEPLFQDQQYGRISAGRYNSIFIGGAAHELGHLLGLPHCKERADESARGHSLMGSGNRTYHEELRGEGRGSFLTLADALQLASHPMFSGCGKEFGATPKSRLDGLQWEMKDGFLEVSATVSATPDAYAVIAYNDPAGDSDYDATTWTAPLDSKNHFTLKVGEFKPGAGELRIKVCHLNGATTYYKYPLSVNADKIPDLSILRAKK